MPAIIKKLQALLMINLVPKHYQRTVHPHAFKEATTRLYFVPIDIKDQLLRTFAVDRMYEIDSSNTSFKVNYNTNIPTVFHHAFGTMNYTDKVTE